MSTQSKNAEHCAIIYDFDGTLSPGNLQEHHLLPEFLEQSPESFWKEVKSQSQTQNADQILIYLLKLISAAKSIDRKLEASVFQRYGEQLPFFEGVESWFERIDHYGRSLGLEIEHYVISSGIAEMIEASKIAQHLKGVFACRYLYDESGEAIWPAASVNYTTKTQYLFRINKGINNYWDDQAVNRAIPEEEKAMPFKKMIYLGDGDTDIPSMKMVRFQQGHSIAVFDPKLWESGHAQEKAYQLIAEDRANFVVPADYREGSQLDVTIKGLLGRLAPRAL